MERKLHLLETFMAQGSDGKTYKVCGYEHMGRDESTAGVEGWESLGVCEYRLADGERLDVESGGWMRIASSGVMLPPPA